MRTAARVLAITALMLGARVALADRDTPRAPTVTPDTGRYSSQLGTTDGVEHIRDIPASTLADLGYTFTEVTKVSSLGYDSRDGLPPFTSLGYHFKRVGVWVVDLVRWHGEFVLYHGRDYVVIDGDELAAFGGADVPVRYYLPAGLVVLALAGVIALARRVRKIAVLFAIGAALVSVTVALLAIFHDQGIVIEQVVPGIVGAYELVVAWSARRAARAIAAAEAAEAAAAAPADAPAPKRRPLTEIPLPPPPNVETDPFRAPPRAPVVVVERATTAASTPAPIVADDTSAPPKLLT